MAGKRKRSFGKRKRRTFKRRRGRKGRYRTKFSRNLSSGYMVSKTNPFMPLPNRFKTKLKYVETNLALNPGVAGTVAGYFISANSLFDPNATGVGHQPMGFDQMMTFYKRYNVIGARIKVTFYQDSTATYPCKVGIYKTTLNSLPFTEFNTFIEQGNCTYTRVGSGFAGAVDLVSSISIKKFLGGKKVAFSDDWTGTSTSSPTNQVYFGLIAAPDAGIDAPSLYLNWEVEYIAIFYDPNALAQS